MTRRAVYMGLSGILCLALGGSEVAHREIFDVGTWHKVARSFHHRAVDLEMEFSPQAAPLTGPVVINVAVDTTADRHPISPYIYGMAFAPANEMVDLRLGVNRWGGNDKSRYNWVLGNACNAARDWRWANRLASTGNVPPGPSSAADRFVQQNRRAGAASLITIPTIGWVARDSNNQHTSLNVPAQGGAPLTTADGAIAGYDPALNRERTSVRSEARKGAPFSEHPTLVGGVVYQDEWVNHFVRTFGNAAHGGVRLYAMDNEPDLWDSTHTDVHPARMGYDDILSRFLNYATAVKDVDPTAEITGPVSWGWTGYEYSALDRGEDNFKTHADRARHGDEPFLLWFLKNVRAHDAKSGRRSLDVLDVHYYPQGQGIFGGSLDGDTPARRLRATRSLWDPTYTDESWIDQPVQLIPRLKQWIAQGYPGTKIGITEWNFGADKDINGALAIADTLGIFGREGAYLANYWTYPPIGSPGYLAFKLYRTVDGRGFGDLSCRAISANPDRLSCYAATDLATGDLTLLLINKLPQGAVTSPITVDGRSMSGRSVKTWTLSAAHPREIVAQVEVPGTGGAITLPPYSATLVRQKRGGAPR